jgi:hypothetical protein
MICVVLVAALVRTPGCSACPAIHTGILSKDGAPKTALKRAGSNTTEAFDKASDVRRGSL